MAVHVEKLDHVTYQVRDLEKAMEFYSKIFGSVFSKPVKNTDPVWDHRLTIDQYGQKIVAPLSTNGKCARLLERRGEGVAAVEFKVYDLDQAEAEMKKFGIRVVGKVEEAGGAYKEILYHPKDCFGVMIGLCEYTPKLHPLLTSSREGINMYPDFGHSDSPNNLPKPSNKQREGVHVEKLHYIASQVWDLEKAMDFFTEVLGCKFIVPGEVTAPEWDMWGTLDQFGQNIVAPRSPESITAKLLEKRGEGVAGVMFKVYDYEHAKAEMNRFGVRVVDEPEAEAGGAYREIYYHPKDCFGVMLGLCHYEPWVHPQFTVAAREIKRDGEDTLRIR